MKPNKQPYENTFDNRVAKFKREQEEKPPLIQPTPVKGNPTAGNPYLRARLELLAGKSDWHRNELLDMEKNQDTDNRVYSAFVKEVAVLGDSFNPI